MSRKSKMLNAFEKYKQAQKNLLAAVQAYLPIGSIVDYQFQRLDQVYVNRYEVILHGCEWSRPGAITIRNVATGGRQTVSANDVVLVESSETIPAEVGHA